MKKRAFTMIELIFVIVVVGILAAIMIPKLNRNASREAANQILTHIRYTQHLAMQDDKYENFVSDNPVRWYRMRWGVAFNNTSLQKCSIDKPGVNTWKYSVFFDKSLNGNINSIEKLSDLYLKEETDFFSDKEAVNILEKNFNKNISTIFFKIAEIYSNSNYSVYNRKLAIDNYKKANDLGLKLAKERVKKIEGC